MWNANLYNVFSNERALPSIDLASRVHNLNLPIERILDVGCGSGLSTLSLANNWQNAEIIGVDLDENMLQKAKKLLPSVKFYQHDCSLPLDKFGKFDLIFSNAFLQWIPNKKQFIDNCFEMLNDGGIFACQIPLFNLMPANKCLTQATNSLPQEYRDIAPFRQNLTDIEYCNILSNHSDNIQVWMTDYYHIMQSHDDIVKFMSSTALRPYQSAYKAEIYEIFVNNVLQELKNTYPLLENGKVLFPFKRLFLLAVKK